MKEKIEMHIPPITDPLGAYWEQPDRLNILIDDKHALMDETSFKKLHHYQSSFPTGVYEGKMWRRNNTLYWWVNENETMCKTEHREIIIVL